MKLFVTATLLAAAAFTLSASDLAEIKTVYLLPMGSGLDQYLALKLTSEGVLTVVTDPKKADAVITDKIGHAFEQKLDELYGHMSGKEDPNERPAANPVSRGHGAIFLVDRKTRDVIWSTYEPIKGTQSDDLNRVAGKIAHQLEKDRKGK